MKAVDWLSERIIFGVMIIGGYLLTLASAAYVPVTGLSRDVVIGGVGVLGTALGMVVQSVFRTDKTDKLAQDTINKLAGGATP